MSFIRTVRGDIRPEEAGVIYAHEHIIIEESFPTRNHPEFLLNDVGKVARELQEVYALGGRTMVDTMPANCGRNVAKLAQVSEASGIHVIVPTGLHLEQYYPSTHWRYQVNAEELAALLIADIEEGVDAYDYNGPCVRRTAHKAGLLKLATGDEPISPHQETIFQAVVGAHRRTGAPILTHTNAGLQALEQVRLFETLGADLSHVVLSHMDKCKDSGYIREVLQTGVRMEFDSAFRWKGADNWTYTLLETLLPEFPDQLTAGMDAAKHAYWKSYGGTPGLAYLMTTFREELRKRRLDDYWENLMVRNPVQLYTFKAPAEAG